MSIPININRLLEKNIIESARIEYKEGWNPNILKTISAFANDIDNWGGGYIVIGVKEEYNIKSIIGVKETQVDKIQKEIIEYCNYLTPRYIPIIEAVTYKEKLLILIWCPGGYERPYKCPKIPNSKHSNKIYYIRKAASTLEANKSEEHELLNLNQLVPFDDRVNIKSNISDLKHPLIRNYLSSVKSSIYNNSINLSVEELSKDLKIADGPSEYFKPLNVGLLFFNDNPEDFFRYARIEVVNIPDETGNGMEERIFRGPIDQQLKSALSYIKNNVIAFKIFKYPDKAEADKIYNYSYQAIEEFLCNCVYHKSYQQSDPIIVRIELNKIEITSMPGPDRSISNESISCLRMKSNRYRNRRIGDFLKELNMVEGRNTGIPTAINSILTNGSPLPIFVTDDDRTFFSVILPINKLFFKNSCERPQEEERPQNRPKERPQEEERPQNRPKERPQEEERPQNRPKERLQEEERPKKRPEIINEQKLLNDIIKLMNPGILYDRITIAEQINKKSTRTKELLNILIKMNLIETVGKNKSTKYKLKE